MSKNSLHQLDPGMTGGFSASEIAHAEVTAKALDPNFIFARNYSNAGWTAFDEETVQVGYMKAMGNAGEAGLLIGYLGQRTTRAISVKTRVRNMGAHKLREMHISMRMHNLIPTFIGNRQHPIFFTFERLLQLFFPNYEPVTLPQRIRNWVPAEGTFWYHWWIEREEIV